MQWEDCITRRHVIKMNTASPNCLNRSNHSNVPSVNVRTILKCNLNIQTSDGYELAHWLRIHASVELGGRGGNHQGSAECNCLTARSNIRFVKIYQLCCVTQFARSFVCYSVGQSVGQLVFYLVSVSQSAGQLLGRPPVWLLGAEANSSMPSL